MAYKTSLLPKKGHDNKFFPRILDDLHALNLLANSPRVCNCVYQVQIDSTFEDSLIGLENP